MISARAALVMQNTRDRFAGTSQTGKGISTLVLGLLCVLHD